MKKDQREFQVGDVVQIDNSTLDCDGETGVITTISPKEALVDLGDGPAEWFYKSSLILVQSSFNNPNNVPASQAQAAEVQKRKGYTASGYDAQGSTSTGKEPECKCTPIGAGHLDTCAWWIWKQNKQGDTSRD